MALWHNQLPVEWGVVGCGWVARDFVIPALLESSVSMLAAVCDRDESALNDWRFRGLMRTTSLDELLAERTVEAVYVATPNHTHRAIVEACAAAGKHVLCEKPMATTAADAAAMVLACGRAGVRYATAFDQRFHAAHRQLAAMVSAGELGTVTQIRLHYACWVGPDWTTDNWRADPLRAGGGAMIDLAPHGLDLIELVTGQRWTELISLKQHCVQDYPVDDGAVLAGRLSGGALATLHVAYNCPEVYPRRVLELIGTRARILATNTMGQTPGGALEMTCARSGAVTGIPLEDLVSPFRHQVDAFSAALRGGAPYPFPPARDVRLAQLLESSCR